MNTRIETALETSPRSKIRDHMKLLVLGATGGTGLEIVKQALDRGHSVTALVRSTDRLRPFRNRINIEQGDLLSLTDLEHAMAGHDAVLTAFGPRVPIAKSDSDLLTRFAVALINGMGRARVKRVVVESVAFLFKNSILPPAYLLGKLFFPRTVADASAMERLFVESNLDWTLVRPPELTNQPYTGTYRVGESSLPRFGFKIARADVAEFMINATEDRSSIYKIYGIAR
jgi:putative NADH-flavin reductase